MSIETDVLFFLKENGKEEDVINSVKDSNINPKLHWHTDRKSFSIHSGVIFEEFRNSDSMKQIRICLDCVPQKIFPVINKTAFAYPDVSFYDTTTLTGNDIAFSDAVLKIEFEDFVPGDFRLKKQFNDEINDIMASTQAMLAVTNYANSNPSFKAKMENAKDEKELENLIKNIPELNEKYDLLVKINFFSKFAEGTLFARKPIKIEPLEEE